MALSGSYVLPTNRIPDFFNKIRDGQAPERFTNQLLKDWGFPPGGAEHVNGLVQQLVLCGVVLRSEAVLLQPSLKRPVRHPDFLASFVHGPRGQQRGDNLLDAVVVAYAGPAAVSFLSRELSSVSSLWRNPRHAAQWKP